MRRTAALLVAALTLTGCASSGSDATIRVAAAASLTESFEGIARAYEADHPGTDVELQFAGSSDLATQIDNGADLDVFASADEVTMDGVSEAVEGQPRIFATNTLTIVTEPGNPQEITDLADLARPDLAVVVCAPQVPCGHATRTLTTRQEVTLDPASEESSVTDVLTKVSSGEADAGIVYVTDAQRAGDQVDAVTPKGADDVVNRYPIAALTGSGQSEQASDFVDYVTGPRGQKVLREKGFGAP